MFTQLLSIAVILSASPFASERNSTVHVTLHPVGGPPAVRIAGKVGGDITAAEWRSVTKLDLIGCVPDAHIVRSTLCSPDCSTEGRKVMSDGPMVTPSMRELVTALKPGMTFTITVKVTDAKGREWMVAPATYTWKG